ncbi:2207_t:CDS:2, partial [Paraglomus occultum]
QQLELLTEKVKELTERKFNGLSSVELLNHTTDFLNQHKGDIESILGEEVDVNISCISKEASKLRRDLSDAESLIGIQKDKLQSQFRDLRECAYRIHAVFVHSGQASFGHYWVYIYDFENERWLKYNDSYVSEVRESEVFADTTGSTANPYCMVYVRAKDAKEIVNTVCRRY